VTEIPAPQSAPLPAIEAGTVFDTPFEAGCIAMSSPDEHGWFNAYDSDGEIVSFCLMVGGMPVTPTGTTDLTELGR